MLQLSQKRSPVRIQLYRQVLLLGLLLGGTGVGVGDTTLVGRGGAVGVNLGVCVEVFWSTSYFHILGLSGKVVRIEACPSGPSCKIRILYPFLCLFS